MGRVVHFEITVDDLERAKKFYEIFDWDITNANMPGADYWLIDTGKEELGINGAMMPRTYNPQPTINWISVDDIDEMIDKVKAAGGKTVGEKQSVPNVGYTVYCSDTEGNTFGLLEPHMT